MWGSAWWCWVLVNALVHAISDIPVHHNDGPLLLFPFNFTLRYDSPVSYYDPNYYGVPFAIVEHCIDIIILVRECYLCYGRRQERLRQQQQEEEEGNENDVEKALGDSSSNRIDEVTGDQKDDPISLAEGDPSPASAEEMI